jgi:hypothetical protein
MDPFLNNYSEPDGTLCNLSSIYEESNLTLLCLLAKLQWATLHLKEKL